MSKKKKRKSNNQKANIKSKASVDIQAQVRAREQVIKEQPDKPYTPSVNDMNEVLSAINEAVREHRQEVWRGGHSRFNPKLSSIIDQMKYKVPTTESLILPPLIKSALNKILVQLEAEAKTLQDRYFPMVIKDIDNGRFDRIMNLMYMSAINQSRLKLAQSPIFEKIVYYVKQNYGENPLSPDAHTFFLPDRTENDALAELWKRIDELASQGLALVRETVVFKVDGVNHNLIILTLADK